MEDEGNGGSYSYVEIRRKEVRIVGSVVESRETSVWVG
jgi:hypothetical protein